MEHIVLVGDSIFDNRAYTGGEPDVVTHLGRMVPAGWAATLCAVDGATASDIAEQVPRIPAEATCIVVSAGGNDALRHEGLLYAKGIDAGELLGKLAAASTAFGWDYRAALLRLKALGKKMLACTIYEGNLPAPVVPAAKAAIAVFDDMIYRTAGELGLPVLELRRVCTEPSDYANPIEPSGKGGEKIAREIVRRLTPPSHRMR